MITQSRRVHAHAGRCLCGCERLSAIGNRSGIAFDEISKSHLCIQKALGPKQKNISLRLILTRVLGEISSVSEKARSTGLQPDETTLTASYYAVLLPCQEGVMTANQTGSAAPRRSRLLECEERQNRPERQGCQVGQGQEGQNRQDGRNREERPLFTRFRAQYARLLDSEKRMWTRNNFPSCPHFRGSSSRRTAESLLEHLATEDPAKQAASRLMAADDPIFNPSDAQGATA
jgi:hypothetical protein